jgi:hypothetical protein
MIGAPKVTVENFHITGELKAMHFASSCKVIESIGTLVLTF